MQDLLNVAPITLSGNATVEILAAMTSPAGQALQMQQAYIITGLYLTTNATGTATLVFGDGTTSFTINLAAAGSRDFRSDHLNFRCKAAGNFQVVVTNFAGAVTGWCTYKKV